MAALDLSTIPVPGNGCYIVRETMDASAGNAREVVLPVWAGRYTATMKQSDDSTDDSMKIASSGTDGAAIGNDHLPVASGASYTAATAQRGKRSAGSLFFAAGTNSAHLHLSIEVV